LLHRSGTGFSRTHLAAIPTPYFADSAEGDLEVQMPDVGTVVFDLGLDRFWQRPPGVGDFVSFMWSAAIPALMHRDYATVRFRVDRALGRSPEPFEDQDSVVSRVYGEVARLASEHGARLIVLDLDYNRFNDAHAALIAQIPNVVLVRPREALWSRLPERTYDAYTREYFFWSGSPPVLVDNHPNALAHRLIAEEIVAALQAVETGPPS